MMTSIPRTTCAWRPKHRTAPLSLPLLLLVLLISACGEAPAPPEAKAPIAPKPLAIVSTTPLIHGVVQHLVGEAAQAHCLLRTTGELAHGDVAADGTMLLREANVVFMHAVEPFAHVAKTVEAQAATDRIVRLDGSSAGAAAFSVAPSDVVEMISAIETRLATTDPKNAAMYQQRSHEYRIATMQFAQSITVQIGSISANRHTILTNDAQVAAVIRGLGLTAVTIVLPLTTQPTQAEREALLLAIRHGNVGMLAIDSRQSETIREMLADVAKETGAKIILPSLSPWPADDEDYVAWMERNLQAVVGAAK